MPFKDKEKKRLSERTRRQRLTDRAPLDDAGGFAHWLTAIIACNEIGASRAWSDELAEKMQKGVEFDSYLRRIAAGKIRPRPKSAWEIGEGLRNCGLRWASGAYALKHRSRFALCGVLDIAAVDETVKRQLSEWAAYTDLLDAYDQGKDPFGLGESQQSRDESIQALRSHLIVKNHILHDTLTRAWTIFAASGMREAHGLLGIGVQIWENPHSGPAARQAFEALYREWRGDLKRFVSFNVLPPNPNP